ncbi:hypothetical protein HYW46_04670 [Candidatus Daviesbacteria bacterium]|nr:hypothetical protein [Candidatus Daviesbacteria bacterium]
MTSLAPLVPHSKPVSASERKFLGINAGNLHQGDFSPSKAGSEINNPVTVRFDYGSNKVLEYIFHPEQRVRTKFDGKEIETTLVSANNFGQANPKRALKKNGEYFWDDVFPRVDLNVTVQREILKEELIFEKYQYFENITWEVRVNNLEVALNDNQIYFAPEEGGAPLFIWNKPYLYEKNNPEKKNYGVEYKMEKKAFGWEVKKVLTEEGKKWFADPKRAFPVVLDPTQTTSTIQTAVSTAESDYGQQQRKIVWANGALNGDAWYAVYEDAGGIFYEKCVPSVDGCETGTDWTDRTNIGESGGTADTDNNNPSVWWESDRAKMWVVWTDNSRDNLQFVDIDVDAADPGTAGTLCSGADQSNHNPTTWQTTITLDSSDTIYVSYVDTSTSTVNNMYRIATGGCTFTAILSGSGVDASDNPILLATGTQTLHAIFQDGTTIRHSVYVNDGTPAWDSADTDITGVAADNTSTNYSAATDGTDVWLIIDQGTSGVDLWTCAACAAGSTWTNAADPWSSQGTDITEVSLAYDSGTDDIIALALRGSGATEEVITTSTDTTTISWTTEVSLGVFGGGASGLEDLSGTMSANSVEGVGFVVEDATNSELEFSTLPENYWILFLLTPFLPKALNKLRRKDAI